MFKLLKLILLFISLFFIQSSFSTEKIASEHSVFSTLAENSLLLQSDRQETLTVVVGERGHILYSLDNKNWQHASVETRQTLTNVFMLNKNTGWALGHDAVIVKTNDGAKTWQKVFSDVDEQAPLLDLYFKDDVNGIVIGAYGLVYVTEDGGKTWNKNELNIAGENDNAANREAVFTDIYDIHLNDIAFAGNKRFYIAAESGHVLRSDDDAKSWTDLNLPYQGSFFGVLPLSFNKVLAYGLRGHLYLSSDAGITWEKIETGSTEMLTDGLMLADGSVLISGLAGTLLISTDEGKSFKALNLEHRHGLTSIVETKDRSILLTSDVGVELFSKEKLLSKE
jgi:photosystem II stability/assembly factor-like uncharacterized protein